VHLEHDHGHAELNESVRASRRLFRFLISLMKAITIVLAIVCATAGLVSAQEPRSGSGSGAMAKLRGLENTRFEGQQRKDNAALDALFDNSLVWVENDGTLLTKSEFLAKMRGQGATTLEIKPETMTVQIFGDTASVVGIYRVTGIRAGKAYVQRCRFMDTWVLKNGKWVCVAAVATTAMP
jgi:ketosteroid isomerase-like protein